MGRVKQSNSSATIYIYKGKSNTKIQMKNIDLKHLTVSEIKARGILEGFAKDHLDKLTKTELENRLQYDLELGEQLEKIYFKLERQKDNPLPKNNVDTKI